MVVENVILPIPLPDLTLIRISYKYKLISPFGSYKLEYHFPKGLMGLYTFVRGSFCGRVLYHLSNHRLFNYEEEWPGYVIPEKYLPNSTADISESPLNTPGEEKNLTLETKKDFDNEQNAGVNCNETSEEIVPNEEEILVTWDGDHDPENPKNWSFTKKLILFCEIGYLTLSIYIGPALYTPGEAQLMQQFGIGKTLATLPLSMFVLGYGKYTMCIPS